MLLAVQAIEARESTTTASDCEYKEGGRESL